MSRSVILATILASFLLATPAFAQRAGAPGRAATAPAAAQPGAAARGQSRLARAGLDAATAQKVQQIHQKYIAERQTIQQQVRTQRARIAELLRANSNDQNAYRTAIQALNTARKSLQATRDREIAELQQVLTPKQQAQLLAAAGRRNANRGSALDGQSPRRGRRAGQPRKGR